MEKAANKLAQFNRTAIDGHVSPTPGTNVSIEINDPFVYELEKEYERDYTTLRGYDEIASYVFWFFIFVFTIFTVYCLFNIFCCPCFFNQKKNWRRWKIRNDLSPLLKIEEYHWSFLYFWIKKYCLLNYISQKTK